MKALLIGLTKMVDSPELVNLLINYDPGALELANRGTSLLFDGKGIAPGPGLRSIPRRWIRNRKFVDRILFSVAPAVAGKWEKRPNISQQPCLHLSAC